MGRIRERGLWFSIVWSRWVSLRRWHLGKDLQKTRKQAMQIPGGSESRGEVIAQDPRGEEKSKLET